MSMSGMEMRLGLRNRSKSRSYLIGSRSVIQRAYATAHPAADPRPGPTLMPASRACLMRSQVMRKYDENPIDRSEEHPSELQSLMRISYAVFCLKKKK